MPTWLPTITIDGFECLLVLPEINWRRRPRITHAYGLDQAEGRTGIEARASGHHGVRLAFDYSYSLSHAVADEVIETLLAMDGDARIALPIWPDKYAAADYAARRKYSPQHWLNLNTETGAYTLDAAGGRPDSVGLAICALLDDPRITGRTDLHVEVSLKAEEDSLWASRVEINPLAQATWDFEANWATRPEESSRRLLRRRQLGQGRVSARTGRDAPAKRNASGLYTFRGEETIRRALTFWSGKRGPLLPFVVKRSIRPGWDGVEGHEPIMQATFADETLVLEYISPGAATARIAVEQDLILIGGEPAQARPSRAYLVKVWWQGSATVMAWTDWESPYTHAGVTYEPRSIEITSSAESLRIGRTEWELVVCDFEGNPLRAFGRLARERPLMIEIRECDPAVADTAALMVTGEIKGAPNEGEIYTARVALFGGAIRAEIPQHFCQQGCNNTLGDDLCGVDIETLRVDGTLAVSTATLVDVTCGSAVAADYYALGFAQFGAGDAMEIRYVLRSEPIAGGQRLTLHRPLWSPVIGAVVQLYPGCDQQYEGGCARYGNQARFFGAQHKPDYIETVSSGFKSKTGK